MSDLGSLSPLERLRRLRRVGLVPVAPRGVRAAATAALVVYGVVRGPVHADELRTAFQALLELPSPAAQPLQRGGALTDGLISLLGAVCRCVVYSSGVVCAAGVLGAVFVSGGRAPLRRGRLSAARAGVAGASASSDADALRSVVLAALLGGALGVWLLRRYLPELVVLLRYEAAGVPAALRLLGGDLALRVVVVAVSGAALAAVWGRVALLWRYRNVALVDDDE